MVKSGTGSSRMCFTNLATSGSGQISQKQIRYSPNNYQKFSFGDQPKLLE